MGKNLLLYQQGLSTRDLFNIVGKFLLETMNGSYFPPLVEHIDQPIFKEVVAYSKVSRLDIE